MSVLEQRALAVICDLIEQRRGGVIRESTRFGEGFLRMPMTAGLADVQAIAAEEEKNMARAMRMLRAELGALDGVYASSVIEEAVKRLQSRTKP